jgi:hypothetical protein
MSVAAVAVSESVLELEVVILKVHHSLHIPSVCTEKGTALK